MSRVDFARLRLLVVEDNVYMRRMLRTLLHSFGSREVFEAEDGDAGFAAFTSHSPDIVITDWVMPVMDGIELTLKIRDPDGPANPYVPIIMLTGHSEQSRVLRARGVGVTEFLCKPISAKSLHQRITSCVLHPRPFVKTKDYFGPDRRGPATQDAPERRKDATAAAPESEPRPHLAVANA